MAKNTLCTNEFYQNQNYNNLLKSFKINSMAPFKFLKSVDNIILMAVIVLILF
jgi:hypothetical protein